MSSTKSSRPSTAGKSSGASGASAAMMAPSPSSSSASSNLSFAAGTMSALSASSSLSATNAAANTINSNSSSTTSLAAAASIFTQLPILTKSILQPAQLLDLVRAHETSGAVVRCVVNQIVESAFQRVREHHWERLAMQRTAAETVASVVDTVEWVLRPHDLGERRVRPATAPLDRTSSGATDDDATAAAANSMQRRGSRTSISNPSMLRRRSSTTSLEGLSPILPSSASSPQSSTSPLALGRDAALSSSSSSSSSAAASASAHARLRSSRALTCSDRWVVEDEPQPCAPDRWARGILPTFKAPPASHAGPSNTLVLHPHAQQHSHSTPHGLHHSSSGGRIGGAGDGSAAGGAGTRSGTISPRSLSRPSTGRGTSVGHNTGRTGGRYGNTAGPVPFRAVRPPSPASDAHEAWRQEQLRLIEQRKSEQQAQELQRQGAEAERVVQEERKKVEDRSRAQERRRRKKLFANDQVQLEQDQLEAENDARTMVEEHNRLLMNKLEEKNNETTLYGVVRPKTAKLPAVYGASGSNAALRRYSQGTSSDPAATTTAAAATAATTTTTTGQLARSLAAGRMGAANGSNAALAAQVSAAHAAHVAQHAADMVGAGATAAAGCKYGGAGMMTERLRNGVGKVDFEWREQQRLKDQREQQSKAELEERERQQRREELQRIRMAHQRGSRFVSVAELALLTPEDRERHLRERAQVLQEQGARDEFDERILTDPAWGTNPPDHERANESIALGVQPTKPSDVDRVRTVGERPRYPRDRPLMPDAPSRDHVTASVHRARRVRMNAEANLGAQQSRSHAEAQVQGQLSQSVDLTSASPAGPAAPLAKRAPSLPLSSSTSILVTAQADLFFPSVSVAAASSGGQQQER